MEQNQEPRNKPTLIKSINLQHKSKNTQWKVFLICGAELDSYVQRMGSGLFSYTIYKKKHKVN